jgi:hypothetical protein
LATFAKIPSALEEKAQKAEKIIQLRAAIGESQLQPPQLQFDNLRATLQMIEVADFLSQDKRLTLQREVIRNVYLLAFRMRDAGRVGKYQALYGSYSGHIEDLFAATRELEEDQSGTACAPVRLRRA